MNRSPHQESAALVLQGITHRFGSFVALGDFSLSVHCGELVAVIGPNGAGKTTLLAVASGELSPSVGQVLVMGRSICGQGMKNAHRAGVARSFQISRVFSSLTVEANLLTAALWQGRAHYGGWPWAAAAPLQRRVRQLMEQLNLDAWRHRRASELDYAQTRMLDLGLALVNDCPVLLLDEPSSGLSPTEAHRMAQVLRVHAKERAVLMVEHDMDTVFALADRVVVLANGQIVACDTPGAIAADPQVRAAYLGAS